MTDNNMMIRVFNNSSEYFEESTSNLLQLYKGSTSYTGNSEASPDFDYVGNGIWRIGVNVNDSGVYVVKKSTDAGGSYTTVEGLESMPVIMKDMLMIDGGTMEGDIAMASNNITGISELSFNSGSAEIHGIAVANLLDKSATETVTGNWTHTGNNTFTNEVNISNLSDFKLGGKALSASLTASDINMLRGLYSASLSDQKVLTTARSLGAVIAELSNPTEDLTLDKAGLIKADTSGNNIQITMPKMEEYAAGAKFIILKTNANNNLTIVTVGGTQSFVILKDSDSSTIGSTITFDSSESSYLKFVILECIGSDDSTACWAITGGYGLVLS